MGFTPVPDDYGTGSTFTAADEDTQAEQVNKLETAVTTGSLGQAMRPLGGYNTAVTSTFTDGLSTTGVGTILYWEASLNSPSDPVPWRVTNAALVAATGNPYICLNNNNGQANAGWPQPIVLEFVSNATRINVQMTMESKADVWAMLDDQIVYASHFQHYTGTDAEVTWVLEQSAAVYGKWRICLPIGFIGIGINSGAEIVPTTEGIYSLGVVGDSYTQGGIITNNAVSSGVAGMIISGGIFGELEQLTGWDIWRAGEIGTGYVEQGSLSTAGPYGSTARMTALAAFPTMDAWLVLGSVNDSGSSPSTVATAGNSMWNALAALQPGVPIIVAGPECLNLTPSSANIANNAALKTAAEANSNVLTYIDLLAAAFITGTGYDGSPQNNGNADVYIGGDDLHPTAAGMKFGWAQPLAGVLKPIVI